MATEKENQAYLEAVPETAIVKTEAKERELTAGEIRIPEELPPGIASRAVTKEQADVLQQDIPDEILEILPTGELYLPQVHYRRILSAAFGLGGWALVPRGDWARVSDTLTREYWLMAEGRFISQAQGESDYKPTNQNMTWATVTESVKSNALMRCCKDLLIASKCWDKRFCDEWRAKHAVAVQYQDKRGQIKTGWRRPTDPLIPGEVIGGVPAATQPENNGGPEPIPPSEGVKIVEVKEEQIFSKKKNRNYTVYKIKDSEGRIFQTFDHNLSRQATDLQKSGALVIVAWHRTQWENELDEFLSPEGQG